VNSVLSYAGQEGVVSKMGWSDTGPCLGIGFKSGNFQNKKL
jgi:hypothetical protein